MRRLAFAFFFLLVACTASPLTGRSQYLLVSESMAVSQSAAAYTQMMGELEKKKRIEAGAPRARKVREITDRLITQAVRERPDSKDWARSVKLDDDPQTMT